MAKKHTKQKSNVPEGVPSSAPALSPELLKEWNKHTRSNQQGTKVLSDDQKIPKSGEPLIDGSPQSDEPHNESNDNLATPENDQAVEDIVRQEGDELLADSDSASQASVAAIHRGVWAKIGHFFGRWWHNKWARWITILFILAAIGTVTAIPKTRYAILNACGVRASVSVTVMDSDTRLPLKNVTIVVADRTALTDAKGVARVEHIQLGFQKMTIHRFGFAPISRTVTVGWGSNPLGQFFTKAVGAQYKLTVHDYVSGLPVQNAEADSGLAAAVSDKKGVITLTMDIDTVIADLSVHAKGYRSETLHINLNDHAEGTVDLVPSAKAVFVDNQQDQHDLVAMDLDGKNRITLLAGTSVETANIALAVDPTNSRVAMVSTRDNVRDSDGFLLSTLSIVGITQGGAQTVAHAQKIQLIDWIGTRLIFQETVAGPSASQSHRQRIVSYDYTTNSQVQLANANQFNTVLSAQGQIYYATSSTDPNSQPALIRVKPDGSSRQTISNQEAWAAFRADFNTIYIQTAAGWYSYVVNGSLQKTTPPTSYQNRVYFSGASNLWVGLQGGQNTLFSYDPTINKDTAIRSQAGLNYPLYWLNDNTAVYRHTDDEGVADYAVGIANGHIKKISNVFPTHSFGQTE